MADDGGARPSPHPSPHPSPWPSFSPSPSQVEREQAEMERMEELVGQAHGSLQAERQKALLLVRNFAPELADELQREFEHE